MSAGNRTVASQPDWNERFAAREYAYGTEPNDFLVSVADRIPAGDVLMLGEGEGRNAVYLAGRGHTVTAVDLAASGLEKTRRLADERGVRVDTVHADLTEYEITPAAWAAIVSVFCPLPSAVRRSVHRRVAQGIQPGGVFVLEAYRPDQAGRGTGGGSDPDTMTTLAELREDLAGLDIEHGVELERSILEGVYHTGVGAVVQVVARKPNV